MIGIHQERFGSPSLYSATWDAQWSYSNRLSCFCVYPLESLLWTAMGIQASFLICCNMHLLQEIKHKSTSVCVYQIPCIHNLNISFKFFFSYTALPNAFSFFSYSLTFVSVFSATWSQLRTMRNTFRLVCSVKSVFILCWMILSVWMSVTLRWKWLAKWLSKHNTLPCL